MTNEEKQLLVVDLCARIPYKPKINVDDIGLFIPRLKYINGITCHFYECAWTKFIDEIKPYLRSLSNMTDEEDEWLNDRINFSRDDEVYRIRQKWGIVLQEIYTNSSKYVFSNFTEILDWLNTHQFDYRGLIPMGLALEASEEMYKI